MVRPLFVFFDFIARNLFFRIFGSNILCRDLFSLVFLPADNKTGYTEVRAVCKACKVRKACKVYKVRKNRMGRANRRKDDFPRSGIRRNKNALQSNVF